MVSDYNESKKARRVAAIVYLVVLGFIVIGTTISQHQKEADQQSVKLP